MCGLDRESCHAFSPAVVGPYRGDEVEDEQRDRGVDDQADRGAPPGPLAAGQRHAAGGRAERPALIPAARVAKTPPATNRPSGPQTCVGSLVSPPARAPANAMISRGSTTVSPASARDAVPNVGARSAASIV